MVDIVLLLAFMSMCLAIVTTNFSHERRSQDLRHSFNDFEQSADNRPTRLVNVTYESNDTRRRLAETGTALSSKHSNDSGGSIAGAKNSFWGEEMLEQLQKMTNFNITKRIIPPEMINHTAPEIWKYLGKKRLPNFKNPCWYDEDNKLSCLPYFFVIGVPKAGSSDLWHKLTQHPQVVGTGGKEQHWWNRYRYTKNVEKDIKSKMLRRSTIGLDIPKDEHGQSIRVIGDGTPSTFWDHRWWRTHWSNQTEGPPYVLPDVIHAVDPEAKMILSLREPVSRLYSAYRFFKGMLTKDLSPEDFHIDVLERLELFKKCLSVNSLRACAYQDNLHRNEEWWEPFTMHLRNALYHIFLKDWYAVFPRDQMFIMELSDWDKNCAVILPKIHEFLQLKPVDENAVQRTCRGHANISKQLKPMLNETRRILEDFYRPHNKILYEMLQDSRFKWDYQ